MNVAVPAFHAAAVASPELRLSSPPEPTSTDVAAAAPSGKQQDPSGNGENRRRPREGVRDVLTPSLMAFAQAEARFADLEGTSLPAEASAAHPPPPHQPTTGTAASSPAAQSAVGTPAASTPTAKAAGTEATATDFPSLSDWSASLRETLPSPAMTAGLPDMLDRFDQDGDGHLDQSELRNAVRAKDSGASYPHSGRFSRDQADQQTAEDSWLPLDLIPNDGEDTDPEKWDVKDIIPNSDDTDASSAHGKDPSTVESAAQRWAIKDLVPDNSPPDSATEETTLTAEARGAAALYQQSLALLASGGTSENTTG